jgi:hypothetical protein
VEPDPSSRTTARRIVEEVLADHAARATALDGARPLTLVERPDTAPWRAARRIVEQTLAEHAAKGVVPPGVTVQVVVDLEARDVEVTVDLDGRPSPLDTAQRAASNIAELDSGPRVVSVTESIPGNETPATAARRLVETVLADHGVDAARVNGGDDARSLEPDPVRAPMAGPVEAEPAETQPESASAPVVGGGEAVHASEDPEEAASTQVAEPEPIAEDANGAVETPDVVTCEGAKLPVVPVDDALLKAAIPERLFGPQPETDRAAEPAQDPVQQPTQAGPSDRPSPDESPDGLEHSAEESRDAAGTVTEPAGTAVGTEDVAVADAAPSETAPGADAPGADDPGADDPDETALEAAAPVGTAPQNRLVPDPAARRDAPPEAEPGPPPVLGPPPPPDPDAPIAIAARIVAEVLADRERAAQEALEAELEVADLELDDADRVAEVGGSQASGPVAPVDRSEPPGVPAELPVEPIDLPPEPGDLWGEAGTLVIDTQTREPDTGTASRSPGGTEVGDGSDGPEDLAASDTGAAADPGPAEDPPRDGSGGGLPVREAPQRGGSEPEPVLVAGDPAVEDLWAHDGAPHDPRGERAPVEVVPEDPWLDEGPEVSATEDEFGHWPDPIVPPRRTGRWLITTVLGAVALALLLPLAIGALRDLVSFS